MKTVGVYQAKARLSSLLARAAKGERITITKNGAPVATLGPPESGSRPDIAQVIAEFRRLRKGLRLGGTSVKEAIAWGRR